MINDWMLEDTREEEWDERDEEAEDEYWCTREQMERDRITEEYFDD